MMRILLYTLFALLAVGGVVSTHGYVGNVVSNTPTGPTWPGYLMSLVGFAGFFLVLALNKKEEEMY